MTKAKFIRWANRREKATAALREASRQLWEMSQINEVGEVQRHANRAALAVGNALLSLTTALEVATSRKRGNP